MTILDIFSLSRINIRKRLDLPTRIDVKETSPKCFHKIDHLRLRHFDNQPPPPLELESSRKIHNFRWFWMINKLIFSDDVNICDVTPERKRLSQFCFIIEVYCEWRANYFRDIFVHFSFFLLFISRKERNTAKPVYYDQHRDPKIVVVVDGCRRSEVNYVKRSLKWDLKMVVVVDRWSLFRGTRWLRFECILLGIFIYYYIQV